MTQKLDIYRCSVSGIVVEVVHGGEGVLWCCGRPMKRFSEKTVDADHEQHVPVVERTEEGAKVVVGSVHHAMEEGHHIQWIEIIADGLVYRKFLKPDDPPEAMFRVDAPTIRARAYCTQHGLCIER